MTARHAYPGATGQAAVQQAPARIVASVNRWRRAMRCARRLVFQWSIAAGVAIGISPADGSGILAQAFGPPELPQSAGTMTFRQVTSDGVFKQRPSFSRDGRWMLYSRHYPETIRLILHDMETGAEDFLTHHKEPEYDGVFSPDGTAVVFAFDRTTPNQGNIDVYRCLLASRELTAIATGTGGLSHEESPDWAPDGKRIVYSSTVDGNQEIYVAAADGSDATRLSSDPALDAHPAWSPDGQWIAFSTDRWGDLEIAMMHPDGTGLVRLTESRGMDDYPAWSPDGTRIAFVSMRTGDADVYVMQPRHHNTVRVTLEPGIDSFPAWTADGRLSIVSDRGDGFDIWVQNVLK